MNIKEISETLVDLLKQGRFEEAQRNLFAEGVVSTEPEYANIPPTTGLEAILAKGAQFRDSVEAWHGISVSEPIISANYFAVQLKVDLTFKGQEQSSMDELIVYKVEEGKIKTEQFFY